MGATLGTRPSPGVHIHTRGRMGNETTVRPCTSLCLSEKDPRLAVLAAVVTACACRQMPAQPVPYHRKWLRGQMQTVIWQLSRAGELLGS